MTCLPIDLYSDADDANDGNWRKTGSGLGVPSVTPVVVGSSPINTPISY